MEEIHSSCCLNSFSAGIIWIQLGQAEPRIGSLANVVRAMTAATDGDPALLSSQMREGTLTMFQIIAMRANSALFFSASFFMILVRCAPTVFVLRCSSLATS